MVFYQQMFTAKLDNGATGYTPGERNGLQTGPGQPLYAAGRAVPTAGWHPDRSVTDVRGGPVPGAAVAEARLRAATGSAPGEPVQELAVPALAKGRSDNGGRTPEDALGYHPHPGSTSGSATPLADLRHATRPGQGRHPSNGRFLASEDLAAGHQSVQGQPSDRSARLFTPAVTDYPTAPGRVESRIQHSLAEHLASARVQSVDFRNAAGQPAFARQVQDPATSGQVGQHLGESPASAFTPDTRAAKTPAPLIDRDSNPPDAVPSLPQANSAAFRGGFFPQPAFGGVLPAQATCRAPGWDA